MSEGFVTGAVGMFGREVPAVPKLSGVKRFAAFPAPERFTSEGFVTGDAGMFGREVPAVPKRSGVKRYATFPASEDFTSARFGTDGRSLLIPQGLGGA